MLKVKTTIHGFLHIEADFCVRVVSFYLTLIIIIMEINYIIATYNIHFHSVLILTFLVIEMMR